MKNVSAVETKHRAAVESSEAAMRAAQAIINHFSSRYSNGSDTCFSCAYADHQLPEIAAIIDREMHYSETVETLRYIVNREDYTFAECAEAETIIFMARTALERLTSASAPTAPATFEEAWVYAMQAVKDADRATHKAVAAMRDLQGKI